MKSTYETVGGEYRLNGDYMLPDLEVPECPKVGIWGERRRKYLREYQKALYTAMMLSNTLNAHLEEVDRTAAESFLRWGAIRSVFDDRNKRISKISTARDMAVLIL